MAIPRRAGVMALNASGNSGHVNVVALGHSIRLARLATVWFGWRCVAFFACDWAVYLMAEHRVGHESLHNL